MGKGGFPRVLRIYTMGIVTKHHAFLLRNRSGKSRKEKPTEGNRNPTIQRVNATRWSIYNSVADEKSLSTSTRNLCNNRGVSSRQQQGICSTRRCQRSIEQGVTQRITYLKYLDSWSSGGCGWIWRNQVRTSYGEFSLVCSSLMDIAVDGVK